MMEANWIEKFEDYNNGKMEDKEKILFEDRLIANPEMKEAYEIFCFVENEKIARKRFLENENNLNLSLNQLGKKYFNHIGQEEVKVVPIQQEPFGRYKFFLAIAASMVIVFAAYFLFFSERNSQTKLANEYFASNLLELGQVMSGNKDTLQLGIAAYNIKEYDRAIFYFSEILKKEPKHPEAIENLGLTYLAKKDYLKALEQFENLESITGLYSNPGKFLKAVTLMMRGNESDQQASILLLKEVISEKAEGYQQALQWIEILE